MTILFLKKYIMGDDEWIKENYKKVARKSNVLYIVTMIFYFLFFILFKSIPTFYEKTHCWLSLRLYNMHEMYGTNIIMLVTGIVSVIFAWGIYIEVKTNKAIREIENADISRK